MMRRIIAFFIENQLLVNLALLGVVIIGALLASRMNTSVFPAEKEKYIIVEAVYPGASPQEIEEGITLKVEDNLKGVSGIERVTSVSYENTARIQVEIKTRAKAAVVLQDVKNAVDQISNFPEGVERMVVYVQEIVNFTAKLAVVGDVSLAALEATATLVEDELRTLPEISKIAVAGYPDPEIAVEVREAQLQAYGLTFAEVGNAIADQNIQATGGRVKGKEEVIIRSDHKVYHADALRDLVLKTMPDGSQVRLADVADLRDDWAETTNRAFYNGKPAVFITVSTLNQEDILTAAREIEQYVQRFNSPESPVQLVLVKDGTVNLKDRIALLQKNGIIGALLVFVILALFLRIRLAFWVALGIPVSFLGMFIVAYFTGITINVLSVFGMILVIGILVDDGIVVGENVFQHYERGESRLKAVINGTVEVLPAVFSAIFTTCVAFSFFFFIDGRLGEFFSDVAVIVSAALAFSLIEVVLFLPAHLAHIRDLTPQAKPNRIKEKVEQVLFRFRDTTFVPVLDFALRYKAFTFLVITGALVLTFGAIGGGVIRTTFFPNVEQNEITISLELPSGTSEAVTMQTMEYIMERTARLNERYAQDPAIGKRLWTDVELVYGPQSNEAKATLYLLRSEERNVRSFTISGQLREAVGAIPGAQKLTFATQTPFGKPINISFSAPDFDRLRAAVDEFKTALLATGQAKDLITNDRADQPEVNVVLNEAGRAMGFTERSLINQVRGGFFGYEAQRLQRGDKEVKVWIRLRTEDRKGIEELSKMRVLAPNGARVALEDVATLVPMKGLLNINHRDGKREITVEGEIAGLDVSTTELLAQIQTELLPPILGKYPGVKVTYEGQQRETARLQASVGRVGPFILLLIVITMIISFRSYSQAFALLLLIPYGLIGAGWGHVLHDQPMSVLSFLGVIALLGVLINDGLVFINAFNQYLQSGMSYDRALRETAISRFRPILLTTVTTSVGLGPLILERSFQAQFLIPMAISIAYGLLLGSFLLVILLPITMSIMNRFKVYTTWLWTGTKPNREAVEQAIKRKHIEKVEF